MGYIIIQRIRARHESMDAEIASLQAQVQQLTKQFHQVNIGDHVMLIMSS